MMPSNSSAENVLNFPSIYKCTKGGGVIIRLVLIDIYMPDTHYVKPKDRKIEQSSEPSTSTLISGSPFFENRITHTHTHIYIYI